jgi:enolase-phosphatase E1
LPVIVTDIEGTTTPIAFVADILFPFARAHMRDFLQYRRGDPAVAAAMLEARYLAAKEGPEPYYFGSLAYVLDRWMAEDRKAPPLKTLQGMLWAEGYADGRLKGEIYDEVPAELTRWRDSGYPLYVYSSGSVQAQQLLFRHSRHGDLTPLFSGYFDTAIGPKVETASYLALAKAVGTVPADILFLSDNERELDAAAAAGLRTICIAREGAATGRHETHRSFDSIDPAAILGKPGCSQKPAA